MHALLVAAAVSGGLLAGASTLPASSTPTAQAPNAPAVVRTSSLCVPGEVATYPAAAQAHPGCLFVDEEYGFVAR